MPTAHLTDRAIVAVTGPEAEPFLQNILTLDLDSLDEREAKPGALLSPQGKILFDFLVSRIEGGFRLEVRAEIADDFVRRLMLYRLRARAEIGKQDQSVVAVTWRIDSAPSQNDSSASRNDSTAVDRRFPGTEVLRFYGGRPQADATEAEWRAFRISRGVPESGEDYRLGDAYPHDALLDQMGGVGFKKGCYVGQEVVSRMQHRGAARRRILLAEGASPLPEPGTPVLAAERALGALGTVADKNGLALVRIDRVKKAMDADHPITAGGVELSLRIPDWARFTFPADAATADEA